MTNSTEEFWDVDGVSLTTFAYNISSLGGDRLAPPPLRGSNLTVPHSPGRIYQQKMVDQNTITLGMWVIGAQPDGSAPVSGYAKQQFNKNFRMLRRMLFTPNREFTLTKRFYDEDGVLRTASAKAQYGGGLNPTMQGQARAVFTVDLVLADPYFYGTQLSQNLVTGTQNVNVLGDDNTRNIIFTLQGSRNRPKIRNNTLGIEFEYAADLSAGAQAVVDIRGYSSSTTPSGGSAFKSSGSILHSGAAAWFALAPGVNSITVSSTSGTGVITMQYQEAWF
jgi:hypothetical protein